MAVPHICCKMREKRGSATHTAHDARETWQCHTFAAGCTGNVAVPHMWCTMRGKRGSATRLLQDAREPWQCHASHAPGVPPARETWQCHASRARCAPPMLPVSAPAATVRRCVERLCRYIRLKRLYMLFARLSIPAFTQDYLFIWRERGGNDQTGGSGQCSSLQKS